MKTFRRLALFYRMWSRHCALGFERTQAAANKMAEEMLVEAPKLALLDPEHEAEEQDEDEAENAEIGELRATIRNPEDALHEALSRASKGRGNERSVE